MSVAATQAAIELQNNADTISPYQVISLLLDGAFERLEQAQQCYSQGDTGNGEIFIRKIIGIINGLRASLDMERGGEVAENLESVYEYIVERLLIVEKNPLEILAEVSDLLGEIKSGWDGISNTQMSVVGR